MFNRLTSLVLFACCIVFADEFPLEWALLQGLSRERLVERLSASGRTNEVDLLKALATDDRAGAERALRCKRAALGW